LDDNELEKVIYSPVCAICKHLTDATNKTCKAFPKEIPKTIWDGGNNHKKPYPNDNGISFEPLE